MSSCPFRALEYGDIGELRAEYGTLASVAPLIEESVTLPNLVIKPEKNTRKSGDRGGKMHLPHAYQGVEDEIV
ncbi:hypothetical protein F1B92_00820 [Campylobacter sp. FMV-PI01]|uniref:Uncharacterized protein n=1 Tax=Campylobacter portucalensis TaxID=2608384 RepID=A0A6L5WFU1_9BACT|nr:hypothetical protein [Campylobacter portucalensis]MSN95749.1 hypothetical protein [Campylobacter portucalensis]